MARILEYRDIPLSDLVIGKGQVRVQDPSKGVEELAVSIATQGLLQPIVVCQSRESAGKWEILTGQRRFLAHIELGRDTISAAVLDEHVDEAEAKAISITENLIRRQPSGKELKDGILFLYKRYGSVKDVVEETGISNETVRKYVKFPRLVSELQKMVDENEVDINAALRAQDAADDGGRINRDVAVKLAKTMNLMSGAQQKKLAAKRREDPERPIDDVIEDAKSGGKVVQIRATVTEETHRAIQGVAREDRTNQDDAIVTLIEEALGERGMLGD